MNRDRRAAMQAIGSDTARFTLHLTAPSAVAHIAAPVLAAHLGISTGSALSRLMASPGPIARKLAPQPAQLLYSLLSALGLNLRLHLDDDWAQQCDLSIQSSIWADRRRTGTRLAAALGRESAAVIDALGRPGGLILPDLNAVEAQNIERNLAGIRGLIVLRSVRDGALYDLFAMRPLSAPETDRLYAVLQEVKARPYPLTGALAAGLDAGGRDRVLAALPDAGLIALERGIQRFDLHLVGVRGWLTRDLADFLAARTAQPRARFEVISPEEPVPLDHGLTHAVLRQFCADYAAIGLLVRPVLRGLAGFPDNPIL